MEIIDVIKTKKLKNTNFNECIKALHDLDYLVAQLKLFKDTYYEDMITNKLHPFIINCILESTLLCIRRLYEFFFYFDIQVRKDKKGKILDKQNWKIYEDAFAEYFFPKIDEWHNLKLKYEIDYDTLNNKMSKKFELDIRAIHFTFNKKNNWNNIIFIIPELIKIYEVFKAQNMFDKNKKNVQKEIENTLKFLLNTNYHTGNKSKNEFTKMDIIISELIENIYDTNKIENDDLKEKEIKDEEGE